MAFELSQVFIFIVTFFKSIFGFIVDLILKISSEFSELILLMLSGIGGYFLIKSYERGKIKQWIFYFIIILIIWLMLRFSKGGI